MKKIASILILMLFLLACQSKQQTKSAPIASIPENDVLCELTDSVWLQSVFDRFSNKKETPIEELVAAIGKQFLDVPYVAHTLEQGKDEPLTIKFQALDCTTFAETSLAIARTIKAPKTNIEQFVRELEKIRYRNGQRDGYTSRLHYFSDWIYDNDKKGLVSEPASEIGEPFPVQVNFMSTHPDSYSILKDHPELVSAIAEQEKEISARKYFFLSKENVETKEPFLYEGDIVGLATSIGGLDITHVGILVKVKDRIHLMHASSLQEKVVISELPLADLLKSKKSYTGIMIARPE